MHASAIPCHSCHPAQRIRLPPASLLEHAGFPQSTGIPSCCGSRPIGWASSATACLHGVAGPLERLARSGAAPGRHPPAELRGPELHLVPAPAPVRPPAGAWSPAEPQRDLQGECPLRAALAPWHGLRRDPGAGGCREGPAPGRCSPPVGPGPGVAVLGLPHGPYPGSGARGWSPGVAAVGPSGLCPCPLPQPCACARSARALSPSCPWSPALAVPQPRPGSALAPSR